MYLTRSQTKSVILSVLYTLDYDTYKNFLPDCSEDIEAADQRMEAMIDEFQKVANLYQRPDLKDEKAKLEHARSAGLPRPINGLRGTSTLK